MLLCFSYCVFSHICRDDHKFQKHKQISRIFGRVEVIEKEW